MGSRSRSGGWLLVAGLLAAASPALAQRVCGGLLTDSLQAPLPGVSVFITTRANPAGLAYTTTDKAGRFELTLPAAAPDTLLLEARLLGYRPLTRQLVTAGHPRLELVLRLRQAPTTLREVVVQGQRVGIRYNDTTTFEASRYRTGTQHSLEDLLKGVPGFAVSPDGQISYKGTAIGGIYLDGDNLTGINYQRLARSLDASLVGKIQPVERFVENKLLGGLVRSETTVLNITIPPDRKKPLFGSLDAEADLRGYRNVLANVFATRRHGKLYFVGTHNNVGQTKDPVAESLSSPAGAVLRQEVLGVRPLLAPPPLAASDFKPELSTLNNETAAGLVGVLTPESKRWKLLGDLTVYYNSQRQTRFSDTRYLVADGDSTFSRFSEADYARLTTASARLRTNFFATLGPATNLTYELRLKVAGSTFADSLRLTTQARQQRFSETIGQQLGSQAVQLAQNGVLTRRLSDRAAIQTQVLHTYDYLPTRFDLTFDSPARPPAYQAAPYTGRLRQYATATQQALNLETEFFHTLPLVNYAVAAGLRLADTRLDTRLLPLTAPEAEGPAAYPNALGLRQAHAYATLRFDRSVRQVNVSGAVGAVALHLSAHDPTVTLLRRLVAPSGRLALRYALSQQSAAVLSYGFEQELPTAADLLPQPVLLDYRSFYQGATTLLIQPTHRVALNFVRQDLVNLTEVHASVQLSRRGASFGRQVRLGEYVTRTALFAAPATRHAAGQLTAAKFLAGLSLRVQLESTGSFAESYTQYRPDTLQLNQLVFLRNRVQVGTAFDMPLNFFGGASLLTSSLRSRDGCTTLVSLNNRLQADLQAVYRRQKLTASLRADLLLVERTAYPFLSGEASYAPATGRLTYSLVLRNLLDTRAFTQVYYTTLTASTTSFELLPRLIMPGLNYRF